MAETTIKTPVRVENREDVYGDDYTALCDIDGLILSVDRYGGDYLSAIAVAVNERAALLAVRDAAKFAVGNCGTVVTDNKTGEARAAVRWDHWTDLCAALAAGPGGAGEVI